MAAFTHAIDWLVAASGFLTWALFLPQIHLLWKTKDSRSVSLGTLGGSFIVQALVLTQSILHTNWYLFTMMGMSVSGLLTTTALVLYFRRYPGGRGRP